MRPAGLLAKTEDGMGLSTLSKHDLGKGPYQTVHIIGTRASGYSIMARIRLLHCRQNTLAQTNLPLFVFRLQLGGEKPPIHSERRVRGMKGRSPTGCGTLPRIDASRSSGKATGV